HGGGVGDQCPRRGLEVHLHDQGEGLQAVGLGEERPGAREGVGGADGLRRAHPAGRPGQGHERGVGRDRVIEGDSGCAGGGDGVADADREGEVRAGQDRVGGGRLGHQQVRFRDGRGGGRARRGRRGDRGGGRGRRGGGRDRGGGRRRRGGGRDRGGGGSRRGRRGDRGGGRARGGRRARRGGRSRRHVRRLVGRVARGADGYVVGVAAVCRPPPVGAGRGCHEVSGAGRGWRASGERRRRAGEDGGGAGGVARRVGGEHDRAGGRRRRGGGAGHGGGVGDVAALDRRGSGRGGDG